MKDGNSKQTAMPYFESGWVDEKDAEKERKKNSKKRKKGWQIQIMVKGKIEGYLIDPTCISAGLVSYFGR